MKMKYMCTEGTHVVWCNSEVDDTVSYQTHIYYLINFPLSAIIKQQNNITCRSNQTL